MTEETQYDEPFVGAQSKVKLIKNTRGVQWEISVVEGATEEELDRLREIATAQHQRLESVFPE